MNAPRNALESFARRMTLADVDALAYALHAATTVDGRPTVDEGPLLALADALAVRRHDREHYERLAVRTAELETIAERIAADLSVLENGGDPDPYGRAASDDPDDDDPLFRWIEALSSEPVVTVRERAWNQWDGADVVRLYSREYVTDAIASVTVDVQESGNVTITADVHDGTGASFVRRCYAETVAERLHELSDEVVGSERP